jgi:hypothetical protein
MLITSKKHFHSNIFMKTRHHRLTRLTCKITNTKEIPQDSTYMGYLEESNSPGQEIEWWSQGLGEGMGIMV